MSPQLLIVDDDHRLASMVSDYLTQSGMRVCISSTGEAGLSDVEVLKPDLVVLDWMLPGMDGLEVCKKIRALPGSLSKTPVLMLTAKGEPMDRILGLELGADDYLAKPFEPRELLARIKAILRRSESSAVPPEDGQCLRFGRLTIDRNARKVSIEDRVCELTSYQFDLLWVLAERAGRVLTRDQIMELVRGKELEAFDRSIDVHMGRIRQAIEDDVKDPKRILTVRGVGYVFAKQQD